MQPDTDFLQIEEDLRSRIGAELHDGVGQTLTGLAALSAVHAMSVQSEGRSDAERIHELVCRAAEEVRRLSHGLSPESLRQRGLAGGLELLAESVRKDFRRECVCVVDHDVCPTHASVALHLLRIAQEAVSNAMRHGAAKTIWLSLRKVGAESVLEITDDGRGMELSETRAALGIGVQTMQARASAIGAALEITSEPGQGVRVCCHWLT